MRITLAENIFYVGVNDRRTELFENLATVPITKAEIEAARKDFYSAAEM